MEFYYDRGRRGRRAWAVAWSLAYVCACAFLMFRVVSIEVPDPMEDAIVVVFEPLPSRAGAQVEEPEEVVPTGRMPEQAVTTQAEDAPELPVDEVGEQTPEPVPEPAREVNRRALFPGQTAASARSTTGAGGGASSGTGFSLDGRAYAEKPPEPLHPDPTMTNPVRVLMRVTVNATGTVTNAVFEPAGSTIDRGDFVSAAREAVLKYRFVPSDAELQTGVITVTFFTH